MKKNRLFVRMTSLVIFAVMLFSLQIQAGIADIINVAVDSGNKLSEPIVFIVESNDVEKTLKQLKKADSESEIIVLYDTLFDGFAVKTAKPDILKNLIGVTGIWESASRLETETNIAEVTISDGGTIADNNKNEYEYRGEGMIAAVIDSSFDVHHELFVLSNPNSALLTKESIDSSIEGYLTTSNYFAYIAKEGETPYVNAKIPYAYDYYDQDTDVFDNVSGKSRTHGTHVAGVIGANNKDGHKMGFDGVAPECQLLLMKAGADGTGILYDYAILAAIEDAVKLGANVVNMSFGATAGSEATENSSYNYAPLITSAAELGVTIVCAAGNESMLGESSNYDEKYGINLPLAANPDYGLVGWPSSYNTSISVASLESPYVTANTYMTSWSGEGYIIQQVPDFAEVDEISGKWIDYIVIPGYGNADDYNGIDVKGKIALVSRGDITFVSKVQNAQAAGACAIVIYDNINDEDTILTMALDSTCTIPAVFVYSRYGSELVAAEVKKVKFIVGDNKTFSSGKDGMSEFTSRGITPMLTLKPDITAIGGSVYSTIPGGYGIMSGTSMASPVVAGAALLLKQKLNETGNYDYEDINLITNILLSTANPLTDVDTGYEYSPREQGAGLLDIKTALDYTCYIAGDRGKSKIELGDKIGKTFEIKFTVHNTTDKDIDYKLNASVTSDESVYINYTNKSLYTGGEYFITGDDYAFKLAKITLAGGSGANINKYGSESKASEIIKVPANGELEIILKVEIDSNTFRKYGDIFKNGFFAEGFVWLNPLNETEYSAISVPYVGFCGDWNKPPVFSGEPNNSKAFYTQYAFSYLKLDESVKMYAIGSSAYYDTDEARADLISISPNNDGWGDYIALQLTPQRNVLDLAIKIKAKSTGEIVYEEYNMGAMTKGYFISEDEGFNKYNIHYLWDGSDTSDLFYIMPDGIYTMELTCSLEWGGFNTWSMDFIVDTVKPSAEDIYIEKRDNKSYLKMNISDNATCIQYFGLYNSTNDIIEPLTPRANEAESKYSIEIDITDIDKNSTIYMEIADFAFNLNIIRLELDKLPLITK